MEQREKRKNKTRTGKRMKTQLKQFKYFLETSEESKQWYTRTY